jgi:single-stranded-DNA-specific exonuclease
VGREPSSIGQSEGTGRVKESASGAGDVKELSPLLLRILKARGFESEESIQEFLNPSLSKVPPPLGLLKDLPEALQILTEAHRNKKEVTIFGDYDVDGTTSAVLLVRALRDWGFRVQMYIPHRIEEGYGLTKRGVESCLARYPETSVVITCDCGISSFEGVEILKARGLRVIVTDHHEPAPQRVAADAVLNPKQKDCLYPAKDLAGVGVAFLLVLALRKALGKTDYPLKPLLDLVALGTICDLAELKGVNRILTRHGLQVLESQARPGVQALCEVASFSSSRMRARDVGFLLGPRINASGRVGLPDKGAHCLLSPDLLSARQLARELDMSNRIRRQMQEEQTQEALLMAEEILKRNPTQASLVISGKNFHLGVVGLMASRLVERYQRPVAVLTYVQDEHFLADYPGRSGLWKGSLRAPLGFHLAESLQRISQVEPELLISFGGHALAAGLTMEDSGLPTFEQLFEFEAQKLPGGPLALDFEAELDHESDLEGLIEALEPMGQGNPSPLLYLKEADLRRIQIMKQEHLKIFVDLKGRYFSILQFRSPWVSLGREWGEGIARGRDRMSMEALVELSENEWNGRRSVELVLRELIQVKRNGVLHEFRRKDEVGESASL